MKTNIEKRIEERKNSFKELQSHYRKFEDTINEAIPRPSFIEPVKLVKHFNTFTPFNNIIAYNLDEQINTWVANNPNFKILSIKYKTITVEDKGILTQAFIEYIEK